MGNVATLATADAVDTEPVDTAAVLDVLDRFVHGSEHLDALHRFVSMHAVLFTDVSEEQPLVCTEVHRQYCALIERSLSAAAAACGLDETAFFRAMSAAVTSAQQDSIGAEAAWTVLGHVRAAEDYTAFAELCRCRQRQISTTGGTTGNTGHGTLSYHEREELRAHMWGMHLRGQGEVLPANALDGATALDGALDGLAQADGDERASLCRSLPGQSTWVPMTTGTVDEHAAGTTTPLQPTSLLQPTPPLQPMAPLQPVLSLQPVLPLQPTPPLQPVSLRTDDGHPIPTAIPTAITPTPSGGSIAATINRQAAASAVESGPAPTKPSGGGDWLRPDESEAVLTRVHAVGGQGVRGQGAAAQAPWIQGAGVPATGVQSTEAPSAGEQGAGALSAGEQGAGEQGTGEQGAGEQGAGEQGAGEQGTGGCGRQGGTDAERQARVRAHQPWRSEWTPSLPAVASEDPQSLDGPRPLSPDDFRSTYDPQATVRRKLHARREQLESGGGANTVALSASAGGALHQPGSTWGMGDAAGAANATASHRVLSSGRWALPELVSPKASPGRGPCPLDDSVDESLIDEALRVVREGQI